MAAPTVPDLAGRTGDDAGDGPVDGAVAGRPGATTPAPARRRDRVLESSRALEALTAASLASVQTALALGVAFLLGLHYVIHGGVAIGDLAAPVLLLVWITKLPRFSGGVLFVFLGSITAIWGWLLGSAATAEGYALDSSWRLQTTAEMVSLALGVGVLLWARTVTSRWLIGAAFGLGMVVNAVLFAEPSENAWKFTWAAPVSVIVLSLAGLTHRLWVGVAALAGLAVVSAALDCRSYSAALALALILVLAAARPRFSERRPPTPVVAAFILALAGVVYWLGTTLLVSGYLGKQEQARTIDQIKTSGSVILGGRPEISATWALFRHRFGGYGAGVVPQGHDISVAKNGMRSIGYDPANGYVEKYMFGGHIELHSVMGDLWSSFGIPGLLMTLLVAVVALRGISWLVARRIPDVLVLFTSVWTLWNVGFSPFLSSLPIMLIGTALALPRRDHRGLDDAAGAPVVRVVAEPGDQRPVVPLAPAVPAAATVEPAESAVPAEPAVPAESAVPAEPAATGTREEPEPARTPPAPAVQRTKTATRRSLPCATASPSVPGSRPRSR